MAAPAFRDEGLLNELERLRLALRTLQAQNGTLRQLVAIHDRLGALVLGGADVASITAVLADLIGRRVLLLDGQLQASAMALPSARLAEDAEASFRWAPAPAYVSRVLGTLAGEGRPLRIPPMPGLGVDAVCVL